MGAYIQRQLMLTLPVLFGMSLLIFLMMSWIPGQAPEILALTAGETMTAADVERLRRQFGLDEPLLVQYGRFITDAVQGDLGRSIRTNRPVVEVIADVFPRTVELAVAGTLVAVILGLVLGVIAGIFRDTWLDTITMVLALVGWSMPNFWLGIIFLLVFAVQLGWFPITGYGGFQRLILPALTLGLSSAGLIARLVRTEIVEQMAREYVTTARAKGLMETAVILRHVLRNSMISVVTVVGLQFGALLGGTVIVENVFARPGVGRVAVEALLARDMPVLQGAVLLMAVIFVLTNMVVDMVYGVLDPRIRIGEGR
jgi:peptide/nickel transport system permease protein